MEQLRLGTGGSGPIVHSILDHAVRMPGVRLEAVYSRSAETGGRLAAEYGCERVFTVYFTFSC